MDITIQKVVTSAKNILSELSRSSVDYQKSDLKETGRLFDRLLQSDLSTNNRIRLFCRQLKRLMDNNKSLSQNFWSKLHDYIIYVLDAPNEKQYMGRKWNRFHKRINFEKELEQRKEKYQQTMKEQKNLRQFVKEHEKFFKEYLQKCIYLHSKIQVPRFIENINNFLYQNYGLSNMALFHENQDLEEKLKCIEIPLDYSNRDLTDISSRFSIVANLNKSINNSISTFLNSVEPQLSNQDKSSSITKVLQSERWMIIMGDPGNAKTTLLRSIMRIYAEAVYHDREEVSLNDTKCTAARIPILIRIGEFASWLEQHQEKGLIEYIGEHTWLLERCHNDSEDVLKQVIYHGHALILLDGLDEIPDIGQRENIVTLVREFIHKYVNAPDFVSAFDDKLFDNMQSRYENVLETQPPREPGGNQIILTSRIVGYDMNPLIGPFITHYLLLSMEYVGAYIFASNWMSKVENIVHKILLEKGIRVDKQAIETLSNRRIDAVGTILQNRTELFLNSSLLTLICTIIFQSPNKFQPKSRIEIYYHAVESSLRYWTNHEPSISKKLLMNFLINLSTYLHLESPSSLIDAFDIIQLSHLTIKQQGITNNREQLREYADKLLKALESNAGIVAERGLQVFGFQHRSFQEYFVAQSLVKRSSTDVNNKKDYSIDKIVNRILSFTINPHFRESLLLTLGWISWQWSFDDYNKFCDLLITSKKNYVIPLGTLLFFDAYNDMLRLPLESVIFTALNNLLNHPLTTIAERYFIPNLIKLPESIIKNWMLTYFKDDKLLSKFCQCLPVHSDSFYNGRFIHLEPKLSIIFEGLWSFHNEGILAKSVIDQTFRSIMMLRKVPENIPKKELTSYFEQYNIDESNIHPLILSVIIAVCGGVSLKEDMSIKICWSHRRMYHESSIMGSLIEYLENNEESHSIKVEILIKQYESILEKASQSDTSVNIIDTFIALICLQGVSNVLIIRKFLGYQALSMAFDKIKQTYFSFLRLFEIKLYDPSWIVENLFRNAVRPIIKTFFSPSHQDYSTICTAAFTKLSCQWSFDLHKWELHLNKDDDKYFKSQPEFSHSNKKRKRNSMKENFQHELSIFLTFIPSHLQKLYYCIFIDPFDKTDSLPLVVLLVECLIYFEDVDKNDPNFSLTLAKLESKFKDYMLENYVSVLLSKNNSKNNQSDDWQKLIDMECQRISEANSIKQNEDKDWRLFVASISLARLSQAQYHSPFYNVTKTNTLSSPSSSEKVYNAVRNIFDPILQIIALSSILKMKDPFIFDEKQTDELNWEMINLFDQFLPCLPLLTLTFLIVRYETLQEFFSMCFQMFGMNYKKLKGTLNGRESQVDEAVSIACQQFQDSNLLHCVLKFFNLLQFNSSLLFQYFTDVESFDSLNITILSCIYLTELAFDSHILQMYTNGDYKHKIFYLRELMQQRDKLTKNKKIMTYKEATWITNYLQRPYNQSDYNAIIDCMSCCSMIEKEALPVIEKWLTHKNDGSLRFFAHYAALQLFIEHADIPHLIDIISEKCCTRGEFRFTSLLDHIFNSEDVDLTVLRQILIIFQQNIFYSSDVQIWIGRQEIFYLILDLELRRITRNKDRQTQFSTKPFLLIMRGCSYELQLYLKNYLHTLIEKQSENKNVLEEEYVAVVIKWIIESKIWNDDNKQFSEELYEYVFTLLHNQSFHQIQKAILNGLYSVFNDYIFSENHVFLKKNTITHLERIISSYDKYLEDVLAICLLVYDKYLRQLHKCEINYNVSNEIRCSLTDLFNLSLTKMISIRAGFCLVFAEEPSAEISTILNWFRNKRELTSQNEYNILLLGAIVYQWQGDISSKAEDIIDHVSIHPNELNTFVCELKDYLNNQCYSYYLSDPTPNYIEIAYGFSKINFKILRKAFQNNSIDATKLKTNLYQYHYYATRPSNNIVVAQLYSKGRGRIRP